LFFPGGLSRQCISFDPFRRLLLFLGLIGLITSGNFSTSSDGTTLNLNLSTIFTSFIFLFILALELKDKLLAKTELQEGKAIQQSLMPEQSPKVKAGIYGSSHVLQMMLAVICLILFRLMRKNSE